MKKYASVIVGLMLVVSPVVAHADAASDAQMISLLQQLIIVLTQQLNILIAQRGLTTPNIQSAPTMTTDPSPVNASPTSQAPLAAIPVDTTRPQIWEAQFGKDSGYEGQPVVRIVTSEPIDLTNIKWQFRNFPDSFEYVEQPISISVIEANVVRDTSSNCWVKCDRGGYVSIFQVTSTLLVDVPHRWGANDQNDSLYSPEFSVSDDAGNQSTPWQTARDVTQFTYEQ